ncbi:armadillo repeat-containing protein 5 [Gastrophryne carolinensis]
MSGHSLSWCLSRLQEQDPAAMGRALSELRSRHVSRAGGAGLFRTRGGVTMLVELLTVPERAAALGTSRRNLELALSLLANSCTEPGSRLQVRQLGGIPALVTILQSVCVDSIWNRVSRALGNLALDPQNSSIIHDSGAVSTLVQILQNSQDGGCLQSCLRALRILGDSPGHRLSICQVGGLAPCVQMLGHAEPEVVCAAARAVCELSRGCSLDCAEQLSPAVPALVGLAGGEEVKASVRQAALGTLCNLCGQGALRPMLCSAGVLKLLIAETVAVREAPTRCLPLVRALCFCCREAVNRLRLRELGGLELLMGILRNPQYCSVHHRITTAFLHYCHDTSAMAALSLAGLAPLLAQRLEEVALAAREQGTAHNLKEPPEEEEEQKGSTSYDFPPEPKKRPQEGGSSEENLRSWLLAEGYISSPDDLPPDWLLEKEVANEGGASSGTSPQKKDGRPRRASSGLERRTRVSPLSPPCQGILQGPRSLPQSPVQGILQGPQPLLQSPVQEILALPPLQGPRSLPPSEVWGPEFPVLLLLSRFSQVSDPGSSLVSRPVLNALLTYITCHPQPSHRATRLLQRLTCDPFCLEAFIRSGGICMLRARLLLNEPPDTEEAGPHLATANQLGRLLLRNLRIQAESPYGVGLISHMIMSGPPSDRQQCALCLPFIYRTDSPQQRHLLDEALHLVVEQLLLSEDPSYFFNAAEFLSSICDAPALHAPAAPPAAEPVSCSYLRLLDDGGGAGDVVFLLDGGERLAGFRNLLSQGCDVFRAMLQGGYAEARQREVRMCELTAGAFLPVLHYLHGCTRCPTFQRLHHADPGQELLHAPVAGVMAAAGRFLLPGLQEVLEDIVRQSLLSLEALASVYQLAELHHSTTLRRDCCTYLLTRPHPPAKRSQSLHQLCDHAHDKQQLSRDLEEAARGRV